MIQRKVLQTASIKAGPEGVMEMYVAAFGNVDKVGDKLMPGAFDETLSYWAKSLAQLPAVWAHSWGEAADVIGGVDVAGADAYPDKFGLFVRAKLALETSGSARHVYGLVRDGVKLGASFAYDVTNGKRNSTGGQDLYAVELLECGPCLIGANSRAGVIRVKDGLLERVRCVNCGAFAAARVGEPAPACPNCGAVIPPRHESFEPDDTVLDEDDVEAEVDGKMAEAQRRSGEAIRRRELADLETFAKEV